MSETSYDGHVKNKDLIRTPCHAQPRYKIRPCKQLIFTIFSEYLTDYTARPKSQRKSRKSNNNATKRPFSRLYTERTTDRRPCSKQGYAKRKIVGYFLIIYTYPTNDTTRHFTTLSFFVVGCRIRHTTSSDNTP